MQGAALAKCSVSASSDNFFFIVTLYNHEKGPFSCTMWRD